MGFCYACEKGQVGGRLWIPQNRNAQPLKAIWPTNTCGAIIGRAHFGATAKLWVHWSIQLEGLPDLKSHTDAVGRSLRKYHLPRRRAAWVLGPILRSSRHLCGTIGFAGCASRFATSPTTWRFFGTRWRPWRRQEPMVFSARMRGCFPGSWGIFSARGCNLVKGLFARGGKLVVRLRGCAGRLG